MSVRLTKSPAAHSYKAVMKSWFLARSWERAFHHTI